jgi:hypothetical protein
MRSNDEPGFTNDFQTILQFAPLEPGEEALRMRYVEVSQKHRDLDDTIARLSEVDEHDELLIARLKKRKLQAKDEITQLEHQLQHAADVAVQNQVARVRP